MIRKWRALIIASCLLLVTLAACGWGVYRYTVGLRTLAIKGNRYVTQDDIRKIAGHYHGRNAVLVSLFGQLNRDIVARIPKVRAVRSDYKWPYAIELTIVEKPSWVRLKCGHTLITVAADGSVLDREENESDEFSKSALITVRDLPPTIIYGTACNPLVLRVLSPIISSIRDVFPDHDLQLELKGMILTSRDCSFDEIILLKDHSIPIYLGNESNLTKKLGYLQQFIWYVNDQPTDSEAGKSIQYIDLRVDGKVLVGYSGG